MKNLTLGIFGSTKKTYETPNIQLYEMDDTSGLGDDTSKDNYPKEIW